MKKLLVAGLSLCFALPGMTQMRQLTPEDAGLTVVIPDAVAFDKGIDNLSNWEPECALLGDGTLVMVANTFAEPDPGGETEVAKVLFYRPDGTVEEYAGFLADDGSEYLNNMDIIRPDGNPAKIAGDTRPGSTRYAVANESTPMDFDEFDSDGRWTNNYLDHIFAVQILELTENGPQKITNVIDPMYGAQSGLDVGRIRNGGVAFLSNGDLVVAAEDRSGLGATDRDPQLSIIDGETGDILNGPFHAIGDGGRYSSWEGVTAYDGGFVARVGESVEQHLTFYDNEGNRLGHWGKINDPDPALDPDNVNLPLEFPNPDGYTTSIITSNRGDHVGFVSNIDSEFVYLAGRGPDTLTGAGEVFVYVTKINATTRESVDEILVNIDEFTQAERVFCAVDPRGNLFVGFSDSSVPGAPNQIVGRFYDVDMEPVTDTFNVFPAGILPDGTSNTEIPDLNIRHGSCALSADFLLVGARAESYVLSGTTDPVPLNANVYTVIESPFRGTTVPDWTVY